MIKYSELEIEIFNAIAKASANLNIDAYVIGGFVRDKILKRPSKDMDIVCLGDGINLALDVAKALKIKQKVTVFKRFGTAMIKFKDLEIEFVGARKESYNHDSRNPNVKPGTFSDDISRRDFTINTFAINLNKEDFGKIIDTFDGLQHLEQKKIVTPLDPDITFSDDPLRMMRAIRFATQLDFNIDEKTFEAIIKNKERIKIVSSERITDELQKIIASKKPSKGFKLLYKAQLLNIIFPELVKLQGVETKNGLSHKDNFYHTIQVLDNLSLKSNDIWLRWAAILHDIGKAPTKRFNNKDGWTFHGHEVVGANMTYKIFKKMRLPLDQKMKFVQKMVRLHLRPMVLVKKEVTDSAIRRLLFETGDDIDALMTLARADITSKNERKIKTFLKNYDNVIIKLKEVEEKDKLRNWQPPITGEEIMNTFGLKPSKEVGIIKTEIREAILEGLITNDRKEAYNYMIEVGKKIGLDIVAKK